MSMPDTNEALSALLDGELSEAETRALEEQLARDPALKAEFDELREVREFMLAHGPAHAPADFHAKILAMVENEPMPANRPMSSFYRRPFGVPIEALAVAAAAVFVVLSGLSVGSVGLWGAMMSQAPPVATQSEPMKESSQRRSDSADLPEMKSPQAPAEEAAPEAKAREIPLEGIQYNGSSYPSGSGTFDGTKPIPEVPRAMTTAAPRKEAPPDDFSKKDKSYDQKAEPPPAVAAAPTAGAVAQSESAPASARSNWRYVITSGDPSVLADLKRIAAKSGGRVLDSNGRSVSGGETPSYGGTYLVLIPVGQISGFDAAIHQSLLASTEGTLDAGLYTAGEVAIQVDIVLFDTAPSTKAPQKTTTTPKK